MTKIYLETWKSTTPEYVFIKTLLNNVLNKDMSQIDLVCVDGWTNLFKVANTFRACTMDGGTNLIIFDADSASNGGGFQKRLSSLINVLQQENLTAQIFLFPNNSDDGDFETLLERLTQNVTHKAFFDCFHDYETCLGTKYVAPNRKAKLFSYVSSQTHLSNNQRKKVGKGEWCFDDASLWNMDAPYLNALKDFFNKWIP